MIARLVGHLAELVARSVLLVVALVALAIVLSWWFGVYDTAQGRCNRGDLGACLMVPIASPNR